MGTNWLGSNVAGISVNGKQSMMLEKTKYIEEYHERHRRQLCCSRCLPGIKCNSLPSVVSGQTQKQFVLKAARLKGSLENVICGGTAFVLYLFPSLSCRCPSV